MKKKKNDKEVHGGAGSHTSLHTANLFFNFPSLWNMFNHGCQGKVCFYDH